MAKQRPLKPDVMYRRLQKAAEKHVRQADLTSALACCERALAALPKTDYHRARGQSWLTQVDAAVKWLAAFYRQASKTMHVKSLYCEMKRFEINTDVWDAEAFAYDLFGDPDEPGWLVGWKKSTTKPLMLGSMKDLQRLYASDQAREDGPPPKSMAASEAVSMLLTLRFMELIQAAAVQARASAKLPEEVPVLAAVHDSDLLLVSYGKVQPKPTSPDPPRQKAKPRPRAGGKRHIYRLDIVWDEFGNSVPFDCLDFVSAREESRCKDLLRGPGRVSSNWKPPHIKLRKRKLRNDILYLTAGGTWAVTAKAKV